MFLTSVDFPSKKSMACHLQRGYAYVMFKSTVSHNSAILSTLTNKMTTLSGPTAEFNVQPSMDFSKREAATSARNSVTSIREC